MQKLKTLLLLCTLLISCKSMQNTSPEVRHSNVVFELQRGGCYGTCPIYTLSVDEDRLVYYHGKRFTEQQGIYEWYMSRGDYKELKTLIERTFHKSETHNLAVQDLPRTTLRIHNNHKIEFKGTCPTAFKKELEQLEKLLMQNATWKLVD